MNIITQTNNEFKINTYTDGDQTNPSVTALNDGGFVVTWQSSEQDGSGEGIYGQIYNADNLPVGSEFQINTDTINNQFSHSVTGLDDGGFVVVWESSDNNKIYGQRYNASGMALDSQFPIDSTGAYDQSNPLVVGLEDGGFVVSWQSERANPGDIFYPTKEVIYGKLYDDDGSPSNKFLLYEYFNIIDSSLSALSDGGFISSRTFRYRLSGTFVLEVAEYNANGVAEGSFSVTRDPAVIYYPLADFSTTGLNDGGFVITWRSENYSGNPAYNSTYGQRYDNNNQAVGSRFNLGYGFNSLSALDNGGFIVTWTSFNQDGSGYGIYGQGYDANGEVIGSEFLINQYTEGDQANSSVTGLDDGSFVVTWQSFEQDGSGYGIYGQKFNVDFEDNNQGEEIIGTDEKDTLTGTNWDDTLKGLASRDDLFGNAGNDILEGAGGSDILNGGIGDDLLKGGGGDDTLIGDAGNDTLIGGSGNNILTGGNGSDYFRFNDDDLLGVDTVTDFNVPEDTLWVPRSKFQGGLTKNDIITEAQFALGSSASTSEQRFIYNSADGALFFDVDGNGETSAVQIATLSTGLALTNADIFVV